MGLISMLGNKLEFTIKLNAPNYCLRTGFNPMLATNLTTMTKYSGLGYTLSNCVVAYRKLTI